MHLPAWHASHPSFKGATQKWVPKPKREPQQKEQTPKLRQRAVEEQPGHSDCTMRHGHDAETRGGPGSSVEEQQFTYGLALT